MSKLGKIVSLVTLAAAAAVLGLASLVFIRPAEAAINIADSMHGGRGFCGQVGLQAAAEQLGMTTDQLSTRLWGGETLASLADKAGVDLQDIQDAVNEACRAAARDAIEQAVTDGAMSREKADWLLEGLDKGYWGGSNDGGFGFGLPGFGPPGFGGHRGFGPPPLKVTPAPSGNNS